MTKELTFFEIRNRIMEWEGLSLSTRVLWEHLCQMAWMEGSCFPSTQTLSKRLQISLIKIKRSKSELIKKQLIHVFHRTRPQTDMIFPFVQFKNIDQRDKNITILPSVSQTLPGIKEINTLQLDSVSQTPTQCLTDTRPSVSQTPIKENIKIKLKEEKNNTTDVVFCRTCPKTDKSDIADATIETPQPLTRKQKSELHKQSRQQQLDEIQANIESYKTQYPAVNIDLQFQKLVVWLNENPKGKTRKNIHRTWTNWLLKTQSNYNVAQIGRSPEDKQTAKYEEYKKYVAKYTH